MCDHKHSLSLSVTIIYGNINLFHSGQFDFSVSIWRFGKSSETIVWSVRRRYTLLHDQNLVLRGKKEVRLYLLLETRKTRHKPWEHMVKWAEPSGINKVLKDSFSKPNHTHTHQKKNMKGYYNVIIFRFFILVC